jgi:trimethylamine--corrinoid protein Co-methyltransferase
MINPEVVLVQFLKKEEIERMHNASMDLLENVGVVFHDDEAVEIFRRRDVRSDGKKVFLREKDVLVALGTAPSRFSIAARNPEKSIQLGGEDFAFAPGYGAPFIASITGEQKKGTIKDYEDFCKLVHTSETINVNGFLMVQPSDVPPETSHLDMLLAGILLCDKPFMGAPTSRQAAADSIEMAGIVWGDKKRIRDDRSTHGVRPIRTAVRGDQ